MITKTTGMISKEYLETLKALYLEKYSVKLTDKENTRLAIDLVNLMRILLKPEPKIS